MKQFIRTTTRLGPRLFLIVGLLAGALAVSGAQTAQAASIGCTASDLITAIDDANANPDTTTIDLATSCTYTLIDPVPDADGYHGLEITTPVTINGNGATITRDSSAPIFRILLVTASGSLTVDNLTVSNGNMNSALAQPTERRRHPQLWYRHPQPQHRHWKLGVVRRPRS